MNLEWYDMRDLKRRSFNNSTWIPLWSYTYNVKCGQYGQVGFKEDYFGAISVMFPKNSKEKVLSLSWNDFVSRHSHNPWVESNNKYYHANQFDSYREKGLNGKYLLLIEDFETGNHSEWYLDQDLLLGLNILRIGDTWICPREDNLEVVRAFRSPEGKLCRVEIRAEHLRDFLCANDSGLLISRYHKRTEIFEPNDDLDAFEKHVEEHLTNGKWLRDVRDIHEGFGMEYGAKIAVLHSGHIGIEANDDVPVLPHPTKANLDGESYTFTRKERRLKHIISDYWQNDWIAPGTTSTRIRKDILPSMVSFIVDNSESTVNSNDLRDEGRWIWFRPTVVNELISKPYGYIEMHSQELGNVGRAKCNSVTFGVNELGLVVAYAKDIALLPEIDKRIWASHNIAPEGGIGKELHTTQVRGIAVSTSAPERLVKIEISHLQQAFKESFGFSLFSEHNLTEDFDRRINRFKAVSNDGLFLLCKEITRLIIERIDLSVLKQVRQGLHKEIKSLKRLELLISETGCDARAILGPLVGVYELRHADSHLPTDDINDALKLAGIYGIKVSVNAGMTLIWNTAKSLRQIANEIEKLTNPRK
jgi:hypothetical protein